MNDDLQKRMTDAMANPRHMGEMADADAVGTVGNAQCGDMLRVWVKYKQAHGKKVIDRASFQAFGCETAIATASLAMELIRGKTTEEALALSAQDLAGDLGPLPPTKIHCTTLVESAIRSALAPERGKLEALSSLSPDPSAPSLIESFTKPPENEGGLRIVFLEPDK